MQVEIYTSFRASIFVAIAGKYATRNPGKNKSLNIGLASRSIFPGFRIFALLLWRIHSSGMTETFLLFSFFFFLLYFFFRQINETILLPSRRPIVSNSVAFSGVSFLSGSSLSFFL